MYLALIFKYRLKSFYEEGEQERMNEQIMILENKVLLAYFMHTLLKSSFFIFLHSFLMLIVYYAVAGSS